MPSGEYVNDYVRYIQSSLGHRWEALAGNRDQLVPTKVGAYNRCIDGRPPKSMLDGKRGPALQGAAEGVALFLALQGGRRVLQEDHVQRACDIVRNSGFTPAVHDFHEDTVHCAHADLALQGHFGIAAPLSPGRILRVVEANGGKSVSLSGHHTEEKVQINFVRNTTLEARRNSFVLDLWFAGSVGLDRDLVLSNLAQTLAGLGSSINTVEVFS